MEFLVLQTFSSASQGLKEKENKLEQAKEYHFYRCG